MRILGGAFRGRAIAAPKGLATRPTGARARAAMFDILAPVLEGAAVADLFAGTGALGLEAISRGAASVDFYEDSRPALEALRANISTLGATTARVIGGSLPSSLREGPAYDLVFMDPPWRKDLELSVAQRLVRSARLAESGTLIVEAAKGDPFDEAAWIALGLVLDDRRAYGDTEVRFFRPHTRSDA